MPARRRQKRVTDDKKSGENAAFALLVFPPLPRFLFEQEGHLHGVVIGIGKAGIHVLHSLHLHVV